MAAWITRLPALATVVGTSVPNPDGTMTYTYEVDNQAGSFDIAQWSLDFMFLLPGWNQSDSYSGGDVTVPTLNWLAGPGISLSGQSAQDFFSLNEASDIDIGELLTGFSITCRYLPGVVVYHEFSADGQSFTGTTLGPVLPYSLPEGGGTLAMTLVGVAGVAMWRRTQRRAAIA